MKHAIIVTALMLFVFVGAQAQSLEKVLEKHYDASGAARIAEVKSFDIKAKMSVMGMEMPLSMKIKKPNKFRVESEVMGQKTIAAYDGVSGWMINPALGAGIKELSGDELRQQMQQTNLEGELYKYKEKGSTAELLGKEDGAFKIKLVGKDGITKMYFVDAFTYLVSKATANVEVMGQKVDVETKFVEYHDFEGMRIVKKVEASMPMGTMTTIMEEVKMNGEIDDAIFTRPAN